MPRMDLKMQPKNNIKPDYQFAKVVNIGSNKAITALESAESVDALVRNYGLRPVNAR